MGKKVKEENQVEEVVEMRLPAEKAEENPVEKKPERVKMVDVVVKRMMNPVYANERYNMKAGDKLSIPAFLYKRLVALDPPVVELDI